MVFNWHNVKVELDPAIFVALFVLVFIVSVIVDFFGVVLGSHSSFNS